MVWAPRRSSRWIALTVLGLAGLVGAGGLLMACGQSQVAQPTPAAPSNDPALVATIAAQATAIAELRQTPTPAPEMSHLVATVNAQATQIAGLAARSADPSLANDVVLLNRRVASRGKAATALIEIRDSGGIIYGFGSGIVLSADGLILTNWHVAREAPQISVTVPGQPRAPARLVTSDPNLDLAILKVDLDGLTPAQLGSSAELDPGDPVLAIGYGLGEEIGTDSPTVTVGVVSAFRSFPIGPDQMERRVIQMTAAVNEGNSGGPLLNYRGEIVGVVTKGGNPAKVQSVNFAVPVEDAEALIQAARTAGQSPPGPPPASSPASDEEEIKSLVRRYYQAIDRGDHETAYALWSPGAQARLDRAAFARQFADLDRLFLDDYELLSLSGDSATVRVETTQVTRVPAGRLAQRSETTWTLERGSEGWRRAAASEQPLGAAERLAGSSGVPRRGRVETGFYRQFLMGRGQAIATIRDDDLTGDIGVETIVIGVDTGCAGCQARHIYVFRGRQLVFDQPADDPQVEPLPSQDGFTIIQPVREPAEALCCPTSFQTQTFRWNGSTFERNRES